MAMTILDSILQCILTGVAGAYAFGKFVEFGIIPLNLNINFTEEDLLQIDNEGVQDKAMERYDDDRQDG